MLQVGYQTNLWDGLWDAGIWLGDGFETIHQYNNESVSLERMWRSGNVGYVRHCLEFTKKIHVNIPIIDNSHNSHKVTPCAFKEK